MDEWIYFLKNSELPNNYKAKGLKEVDKKLKHEQMDAAAKQQYDAYNKHLMVSKSMIETAKFEGRQEGESIKQLAFIKALLADGFTAKQIAKYVALNEEEVEKIIQKHTDQ